MSQRAIVVTGAAGFIGSHVCRALIARGERVVGIDSFDPYYARSLKERNAAEIRAVADQVASERRESSRGGSFALVEADITDPRAMGELFAQERAIGVIHLAAKAGVRPSIADPVGYAHANVTGTSVILEAARHAGVERMVVASSSSVYGNNPKTPFSEEDAVEHPISPYAATKRACELICDTHHHLTRMPTACLRFFTVFGPGQRPDLAIRLFMQRIARGEAITMFGDGSMSRDFTFIDDIVAGVLAAYDRIPSFGYRVWNLGHDHPVRLDEMIRTIEGVVGKRAEIRPEAPSPGDVERTWADLSRARRELDYAPRTAFEEGVARQWAWLRDCGLV